MRYILTILIIAVMAVPAFGAHSFLGGYSGNIITPDGLILPEGTWELSYHQINDLLIFDRDLDTVGFSYGLVPNLEIGVSFVNNDDNATAINGKYQLLPETATRPSIIIGVFDVAGSADDLSSDPGFYFLLSKNITRLATEAIDEPSKPLRLSVGFGTGVYDGLFAGFDWTLAEQFSLMAEFTSADIGGEGDAFNVGGRLALNNNVRLDAALVDWDDFAWGVDFSTRF